jgi:hypothetical protein
MHVCGMYEFRYAQTQLRSHPGFVGEGRINWSAARSSRPRPTSSSSRRWALRSNESEELAAVNALMDKTTVAPVEQWLANDRRPLRSGDQPVVVPDHATFPRMSELVADTLTARPAPADEPGAQRPDADAAVGLGEAARGAGADRRARHRPAA